MSGTAVNVVSSIHFRRTLPVPREQVFQAWIDEETWKHWFVPSDDYTVEFAEVNPRKGNRYRIGWRDQSGKLSLFGGVYQQIMIPELLAFTWSKNGGGTQQHKMFVTIRFMDKNGQTDVQFIHEGFPDDRTRVEYEKQWQYCFERLEKYLAVQLESVAS